MFGSPFGCDGFGIKLDRRRDDFSLRTGQICDRRLLLLLTEPVTRGVTVELCPFGNFRLKEGDGALSIWLPRSEGGVGRRERVEVERDSSSSAILSKVEEALFALRYLGSSRLLRDRFLPLEADTTDEKLTLTLKLSSVFSSSHSLSDPPKDI